MGSNKIAELCLLQIGLEETVSLLQFSACFINDEKQKKHITRALAVCLTYVILTCEHQRVLVFAGPNTFNEL